MSLLKSLLRIVVLLVTISILSTIVVVKGPQLHRQAILSKVGRGVVRILRPGLRSGGTGFHVRLSNGKVAILTNKHVCQVADIKTDIVIVEKDGKLWNRKVISRSPQHDLCLVEAVFSEGISLGSKSEVGESLAVIGHPKLTPLRYVPAEVVTTQKIQVCTERQFMFCIKLVKYEALSINAMIYPGNSGSPLVNAYGNLVGVIFAGGNHYHSFAVPLKYVVFFLETYKEFNEPRKLPTPPKKPKKDKK